MTTGHVPAAGNVRPAQCGQAPFIRASRGVLPALALLLCVAASLGCAKGAYKGVSMSERQAESFTCPVPGFPHQCRTRDNKFVYDIAIRRLEGDKYQVAGKAKWWREALYSSTFHGSFSLILVQDRVIVDHIALRHASADLTRHIAFGRTFSTSEEFASIGVLMDDPIKKKYGR